MDFARSGMLGVVVICIALAGALFGAYLAGIDTEEYEVTAYKYLADMSGEFEYDQSPQYIDFDPNTNYIGYYSTDTGDAFPQDKVDFVEYTLGVNNYRINTDNAERSVEEVTGDTVFDNAYSTVYVKDGDGKKSRTCPGENISLSSFMENLDLEPDTRTVKFRSGQNYNALTYLPEDQIVDWVIFTIESSWQSISGSGVTRNYIILNTYDAAQIPPEYSAARTVALSAELDILTGTIKLYADNDLKIYLATYDASDIVLIYGSDGHTIELGTTLSIEAQGPVENIYMDPTRGVALKD